MFPRLRPALAGLVLLFGSAACADEGSNPAAPEPPSAPATELARLDCTVTVADGRMDCRGATPSTGAAGGLIIGGPNGSYVQLTASNNAFTPGDDVYSIDVTVQNLLYQPLGTADGTTLHDAGVRVLFDVEPYATGGDLGGTVSLLGSMPRALLMRADQAYYQYDEIIHPNATSSPLTWDISKSPDVTSFRFVVYVMAQVPHPLGIVQVTPPADTLLAGRTQALSATVRNAFGTPIGGQTVTWGSSDAGVATVDAAGVVTAVAPGAATITATSGPRTGTTAIVVCPDLAVGEVYVADMPAGSSVCLAGREESAGEYVVVPVNGGASGVALEITGAGIIPVSGPPTPALLPGGRQGLRPASTLVRDDAWESRLRRSERAIPRRAAGATGRTGPRMAITGGVPSVGALMSLNVETDNACSTNDVRTGRVAAVGTHVILLADTTNPPGGFTSADYFALADSFDAKVHPVVTGAFGAPSDRDGNGRVVAFYTRAVNELTPPGSPAYVGGFFHSRDLRSSAECPTSNLGELFYMLAPDPAGSVNGNVRTADFVRGVTLGTLAHEYAHLVNASRRMLVNTPWNGQLEEVWLDEGLAHVAEELMFYQASGLAPRGDVEAADLAGSARVRAAFFKYGEANVGRLRQWLLAPHAAGPFTAGDGLATRGSAWAFLRYAADRRGGAESAFWSALVNTGSTGLANLQAGLGTDPLPWFRDFSAAMYADNAFGLVAPPAAWDQPSWDFRGLYSILDFTGDGVADGYPLAVRNLANGVTDAIMLSAGGGAAYARLGVPAGAFAGVTVRAGGVAPGATVRVAVVRRE